MNERKFPLPAMYVLGSGLLGTPGVDIKCLDVKSAITYRSMCSLLLSLPPSLSSIINLPSYSLCHNPHLPTKLLYYLSPPIVSLGFFRFFFHDCTNNTYINLFRCRFSDKTVLATCPTLPRIFTLELSCDI